ncbi:MAG TPA: DUF4870 domain-containing protein [Lysobacter sp.]|jgi:hypothetical protein|nr:DUF4870 domain-containing protein [Lysobacter sp.]
MNDITQEEKTWGMLAHLSSLAVFIIPFFGNVLGPLVVWLVKKDTMPFVADQGKEALNFNITVALAAIISSILMLVVIGFLLLAVIAVGWLVLTILAAIESNKGVAYRYPFTLRLIK